jgi:hypothetical protein
MLDPFEMRSCHPDLPSNDIGLGQTSPHKMRQKRLISKTHAYRAERWVLLSPDQFFMWGFHEEIHAVCSGVGQAKQ